MRSTLSADPAEKPYGRLSDDLASPVTMRLQGDASVSFALPVASRRPHSGAWRGPGAGTSHIPWFAVKRRKNLLVDQRYRTTAKRIRTIHAIKTAIAAAIAASFELIDPVISGHPAPTHLPLVVDPSPESFKRT